MKNFEKNEVKFECEFRVLESPNWELEKLKLLSR